jgi:hypothetical protein
MIYVNALDEPLASLAYDITNETNWRTNEYAAVVDQFFVSVLRSATVQ